MKSSIQKTWLQATQLRDKKSIHLFGALQQVQYLMLGVLLLSSVSAWGQTSLEFNSLTPATWICPTGVTSVTVECWGGGGGGGTALQAAINTSRVAGGGGGGSYVTNTLTVVPGTEYTVTVGAGGLLGGNNGAIGYGGNGGKSEFSGPGITTITASGGTGGSAGTNPSTAASYLGVGGVLGGVHRYIIDAPGTAYVNTNTTTASPGSATGRVTILSGGAITYITPTAQGSGYTTAPTISITTATGSGAAITAVINPDINAGGTVTLGVNGGDATATSGGVGGAGGGTGGGGGGDVSAANVTPALSGVAPGGGGAGGYTMGVGASSPSGGSRGGSGGRGRVKLTFGTIPIELTYFKAKRNQSSNVLTWSTASEQNNAFFDIQRAQDGVDFQSIGQTKGEGSSSAVNNYTFTDATPLKGTNYYRLRQVDFDGKESLSPIVSVILEKGGLARFYPSVTKGELTIEVPNNAPISVSISDLSGRTVLTKTMMGTEKLDVSALSNGTYLLTLTTPGLRTTAKFVKQ